MEFACRIAEIPAGGEDNRIIASSDGERGKRPEGWLFRIVAEEPSVRAGGLRAGIPNLDPIGRLAKRIGKAAFIVREKLGYG